ncbi:MAG TPA: hypothetical protein VFW64_13840 [Pseudonocardiaceae bacterium]|nr:hypothetical protein [Pseudonocardiaceae bacterium]
MFDTSTSAGCWPTKTSKADRDEVLARPWRPLTRLPHRELPSLVGGEGGVEVDVGPSPIGPQGVVGGGELVLGLRCPNRGYRNEMGAQVSSKQPVELRLDLG